MNEHPATQGSALIEPLQWSWFRILRFPAALFAAAVAPVLAFVLLAALLLPILVLFDAKTSGDLNLETFLGAIGGGLFLAVYLAFYVPCFSIPCVVVFGIPTSILASRLGLIRKWFCVSGGFILGSVPGGLFLYSSYSGGSSFANGVHYWIEGIPTTAGLIRLALLILLLGVMGAVGGYAFWLIWQAMSRAEQYAQN